MATRDPRYLHLPHFFWSLRLHVVELGDRSARKLVRGRNLAHLLAYRTANIRVISAALAMAIACIMIGWLAALAERVPAHRRALYCLASMMIGIALLRGFYWDLFGRGHGFFTANRLTALAAFAAVLAFPRLGRKRAE